MSTLNLQLSKNLRRQILRGHPWIFKQALMEAPNIPGAQLAKVDDSKGDFLCWAIYDSQSPITLRVLTTDEAFNDKVIQKKLQNAFSVRSRFPSDLTTAYRLINGEGDFLPGLVCDIYGPTAVIQYDGDGPAEFWQKFSISKAIVDHSNVETVFIKPRGKQGKFRKLMGKTTDAFPIVRENSIQFKVDVEFGQKTGFFLDQRDNRKYITNHIKGKTLLNLFSYTGGFSIYGARGGAEKVFSVDISDKATALAQENWELNKLPADKHEAITKDVFKFLSETSDKFDCIVVDPPSMASSEAAKEAATKKYTELFADAARRVTPGGDLVLSSCSSHINFNDFYNIALEAVAKARRVGQVLRISGQGFDHPFALACPELRYLKFFHIRLD